MKSIIFFICILLGMISGKAQWAQLNSTVTSDLNDANFVSTTTGLVVGGNGLVLKTTDGGNTWVDKSFSPLPFPQRPWIHSVFFTNATTAYTVGGQCWKTTDCGDTWVQQNTNMSTTALFSVFFVNANTGFIAGGNENIIKTTNGGSTWILKHSGGIELHDISMVDTNVGWTVGYNKILKTSNGGNTWVVQKNTTDAFWSCVAIDANTCYVAGNTGTILKTIDGGTTWQTQTSGTISDLLDLYFVNPNIGFAVGGQGTILITTNGGANWSSQLSNLPTTALFSVFFVNSQLGYITGGYGKLLKTLNGGITSISDLAMGRDIMLFPNPAADAIYYVCDESLAGNLKIRIIDANGKCIKSTALTSEKVDISNLKGGVYVVIIEGADWMKKQKLVIAR